MMARRAILPASDAAGEGVTEATTNANVAQAQRVARHALEVMPLKSWTTFCRRFWIICGEFGFICAPQRLYDSLLGRCFQQCASA
jgi:hypothetical protein